MSHHFDSAADRADGRINPCDLYAFPGAPGTTALILSVNPDAGSLSTPTPGAPPQQHFGPTPATNSSWRVTVALAGPASPGALHAAAWSAS